MDLTPTQLPTPRPFTEALQDFAAEVGSDDPVTVVGGRSCWHVGGHVTPEAREVAAPAGVVAFEPAEMTVRVLAGTTVAALQETLAEHGQEVMLPEREDGTVGGALSIGWSALRRLGRGPIRDCLLEASVVTSTGELVRCGGPTVKNVTGYDLCRILVGSLGTLALVGEVVLRTHPLPAAAQWVSGPADPIPLARRPGVAACLWDGHTTWALIEGHPRDVERARVELSAARLDPCDQPPSLPPHRWSINPAQFHGIAALATGGYVAEVGVGTVHAERPPPARPLTAGVCSLNQRMKLTFDPTGRLNPGRDVLAL